MNELLFFLFAFLTVFLSIKLSFYCDTLSKTSRISQAFIGGILLAGITSLPEFVTCISAIIFKNPTLAIGDILGSNFFNIFMMCFFDIIFIKKMMFNHTKNNNFLIYLFLIINYIFLYLFLSNIFTIKILNIAICSLVIIFTYLYYLYKLSRANNDDKFLIPKLIITAILMVCCSILLTFIVNSIAFEHPNFSSSIIGAILLGVTTSLPEVITFYALLKLDNYDLALSDIIGSNFFNLLVLAIGDVIFNKVNIFSFSEKDIFIMLILGFLVTVINAYSNMRKKTFNKLFYILPSIIIVVIYLFFWIINFVY